MYFGDLGCIYMSICGIVCAFFMCVNMCVYVCICVYKCVKVQKLTLYVFLNLLYFKTESKNPELTNSSLV